VQCASCWSSSWFLGLLYSDVTAQVEAPVAMALLDVELLVA
jgi:hypothetical protein